MFSNNMISFIIINIYILIVVNILLIFSIYYIIIRKKIWNKKYNKAQGLLQDKVNTYIENGQAKVLRKYTKNKINKKVIFDMLVKYSRENDEDISNRFEYLNLDKDIIKRTVKKLNYEDIKNISYMRVRGAYEVLQKGIKSDNFDVRYMSFYAISLMSLDDRKKEIIISELIKSEINRDRIIEIIDNFKLNLEECFYFLKKQGSENGKTVFLRILNEERYELSEEKADELLPFLNDSKEVRLSSVLVISKTKIKKYLQIILDLYKKEEAFEVRVAITKGMNNFDDEEIIEPLKIMAYDNNWWVRFNAIEILAKKSIDGVYALIDLSLDSNNKEVSDLAYYFLNANTNVHNTIIDK